MNGLTIAITTGLIGMIGWGVADYFASYGLKNGVSEETANFWVYLSGVTFCLIAFVLYSIFTGDILEIPQLDSKGLIKILMLALMNFIAYLFFFKALKEGELSVISSVFSTYAAGAVVVSAFFFGEAIPLLRFLALIIVIVGVVLIAIKDTHNFKRAKGIEWAIPAVLIFSVFFPFWDSIAKNGGSLVLVLIIDSILAILYFCYAKFKGVQILYNLHKLKPFVLAGVFTTLAAVAVSLGYENTSAPSIISVVSSAVPVTAVILGYILLKERLTKLQYLGLLSLLIGIALLFG